jgi:hypothetical protein
VYPGTNSRLVCVADSQGNIIPDFSNAGNKGGGEIMKYDDPGSLCLTVGRVKAYH